MTGATHHRPVRAGLLAAAMGLLLLGLPLLAAAQDNGQPGQTHVVRQGETALGIAARYGISLAQLVAANNLRSLDLVAGAHLAIPAAPGQTGKIHLVRPWETLPMLAARYRVPAMEIILANGLTRPDALYVGQRLRIPRPAEPSPVPTPLACPAGCAQISITAPQRGSTVASPLRVHGQGQAYEQTLAVRVLDATGYEIGQGNARIDGPLGEIAPYSGVVTFTVPTSTQPGRIQVYSQSPADGAIEQLASVTVLLQGAGLDEAVEQLKAALESQDYAALAALMTDPWHLALFRSESLSLSRSQALDQLQTNYLGPGQVFVDLSVDARQLLAGQINLAPDVSHVVFSTGWGADRSDDALLLLGTDASGRTRWGGMIYIFGELRPY
jgi:LysM repeat protein